MSLNISGRRRHITKACDACKRRKSKCDGRQPCDRCAANGNPTICVYQLDDGRRRPRLGSRAAYRKDALDGIDAVTPAAVNTDVSVPAAGIGTPGYWGDSSTTAFLARVCSHLTQLGRVLPRGIVRETEVADKNKTSSSSSGLALLPEKAKASEYVSCFFDHLNATYRYLPRAKITDILNRLYDDEQRLKPCSDAEMALFLSVAGNGCMWLASWKAQDLGQYKSRASNLLAAAAKRLDKCSFEFPPSMTVLQAHFSHYRFLIASHKYESAWMVLGITIRLSQSIGLGRSRKSSGPLDDFEARGIFWSIYMADRYLSIILGRPFGINDKDIAIPLPREPSNNLDNDLGTEEASLVPGTVAHIKLLKITSQIMTSLYGVRSVSPMEKQNIVHDFEAQLWQWVSETPEFFHPKPQRLAASQDNSPFYSVPWLFKRQQRTIRSAFFFTEMLLYRGFLFEEFLALSSSSASPSAPSPSRVNTGSGEASQYSRKCRDAAIAMAELAEQFAAEKTYNPVFWATSHFIFCATAILIVSLGLFEDDRATIEVLIERAMDAHSVLTKSISTERQQILEDSRSMTKGIVGPSSSLASSLTSSDSRWVTGTTNPIAGQQDTGVGDRNPGTNPRSTMVGNGEAPSSIDPTTTTFWDSQTLNDDMGDFESGVQMIMDIGFDHLGDASELFL